MRPLLLFALLALPLAGQELPRAVRRTVPVTRSFERALRLGTRDSTGHPAARYWQLTTDYRIDARLRYRDNSGKLSFWYELRASGSRIPAGGRGRAFGNRQKNGVVDHQRTALGVALFVCRRQAT